MCVCVWRGGIVSNSLTSLMSSSISAELQSMSVISPELVLAAIVTTGPLQSVGERLFYTLQNALHCPVIMI